MGKLKNSLLNDLTQEELERMLWERYNDDSGYQQWLESNEYREFVNEQLELSSPAYSHDDVMSALEWAKSAINIEPTDIGKEVYDILFVEKVFEHLNKIRYDRF